MATPMTNEEFVAWIGLPESVIEDLKTQQGDTFTATKNQFLQAIVNKITAQTVEGFAFDNPFKKYDGFPINFGDTIENIYVETPQGYKYNRDAKDPFERKMPSVKALYASINYELQYETTIYDADLRRACLAEYGFSNIITKIMSAMSTAMSLDEYNSTLAMLDNSALYANGFENLSRGTTDAETAEAITKTIALDVSNFKLPLKTNNALGVLATTPKERLVLLMTPEVKNMINFDYLAGVYNLDKIDLVNSVIEIPSSYTGVGDDTDDEGEPVVHNLGFDFAVLDTKAFDCHTALQDGGMIYNPKGKYTNHFLNLWKIVSFKYFYNAKAYKLSA